MSSLRSLVSFKVLHLLKTSAHHACIILCSSDPPCCMLIYLTRNLILLTRSTLSHVTLRITSASACAHAQLGEIGRTCTSWLNFVNQLARKTLKLSCSFVRNGSQEKTLKIELPLSEKHPWTTATRQILLVCRHQDARPRPRKREVLYSIPGFVLLHVGMQPVV